MEKLTQSQFGLAKQFMKTRARHLEKALFEFEFESVSFSHVLTELAKFQNEDGGFGHGLEPDLRCPESSAIATTKAIEILQLGGEANESIQMVKNALQFLENTFREVRNGWEIIPKEAENSPRAPWWNYSAFSKEWGNPNAEIVGYFTDFRSIFSFKKIDALLNYAIEHLTQSCELNEMHELFCYLRLYERLDPGRKNRIQDTIDTFMDNCVMKNPQDREGYGAAPLDVVHSPDSPYYPKYETVISVNLDELIQNQTVDGSWQPNWAWGQYEDEWEKAKVEWQGILTLDALRALRNFNRI